MMPIQRGYKSSNILLMNNDNGACDTLEAMLVSCSPSILQGSGSRSMSGRENLVLVNGNKRPYYPSGDVSEETGDDDVIDDSCVHQPEKKRRLTSEQVKFLEKSFEVENKLEPDRKVQLAKDLNLQPRQVAVWFQNRRARWKTKQLEKDYDALKLDYDSLKADYDVLLQEKEQLQEEVRSLTTRHLQDSPVSNDNLLKSNSTANEMKDLNESLAASADLHVKKEHGIEGCCDEMKLEKRAEAKGEVSASCGSEESALCNANSPHPIDSGLSNADGVLISRIPLVGTVDAAIDTTIDCADGTVSAKFFPAQPYEHLVKAEIEDDETYSYCFPLEDQGSIPWWNSSWS